MLRYIICLCLLFCMANAAVQKFVAHSHLVEDEAAIRHRNAIRSRKLMRDHGFAELMSRRDSDPSLGLTRSNNSYYLYIANATIGTPAKTYAMEIDLWYGTDLCVLGPNANLSKVYSTLPTKHVFAPGNSSTFVNLNGNFTDYVCGKGKNGSDQVQVDQVSAKVALGVIDKIGYYFAAYPIDGILGLNPSKPYSNKDNLVSQLIGNLDKPIMSWYQNQTRFNNGTAQLTLGDEDTDNCKSNYVYAPQIWSSGGYGDFRVHLASASVDGKSDSEVGVNTTLVLYPDQGRIYCNYDFLYVLTNASNAVYNTTAREWQVDCDLSKSKNVVLNIGGSNTGNAADSTTKQLVLTPADYIVYRKWRDMCVVFAYPYEWYSVVELSAPFMNNHCLAYNSKDQTVGYADSKSPSTVPQTY